MEAVTAAQPQFTRRADPRSDRPATDPERELVARELRSQYQIIRPLGRGGVGAVYLVRDMALHRTVALKVLRSELFGSDDVRERFRAEARLSAQLEDPGIVPMYAFGETPNLMYMVMRYVPGGSLSDRLFSARRLDSEETRRILTQVARALDYAHRQGVVHRDLKPENILLDRETGRALLADFSVARRRWWDPRPSELHRAFGTPHFMSPEQALGEVDLDGRSDLYGLGVIGYLMLSGRLPFIGDTFSEITSKHLFDPAPSLAERAPGAPRALVAAIERCLAKELDARWISGSELAAALERMGSRWSWRRVVSFVRSRGVRPALAAASVPPALAPVAR